MEEIIEDESVMEEEEEEGALNYTQENMSGVDSSGKVSFIEIKHIKNAGNNFSFIRERL